MQKSNNNREVFSPLQISIGSFFGGPIAAVYLIRENFRAMEMESQQRLASVIGLVFVVSLTAAIPQIPENFPTGLIPAVCSGIAYLIAMLFQISKEEEAVSDLYSFKSNWGVVRVAVASFLVYLTILAVYLSYSLNPHRTYKKDASLQHVAFAETIRAESFTYNIQFAGYDFDQIDKKGTIDYEDFLEEFRRFPWIQQLNHRNSISEGASATLTVINVDAGVDYWVSIAGDQNEHGFLIGVVYPKEVERFWGLLKPKRVRLVEVYVAETNMDVEKTARHFFHGELKALMDSLNKLHFFLQQEADK
jgi:hypothetical protein